MLIIHDNRFCYASQCFYNIGIGKTFRIYLYDKFILQYMIVSEISGGVKSC